MSDKKPAVKKVAKKSSASKRVYKSRAKVPVKGLNPFKLVYQSPEEEVHAFQMKGGIVVRTTSYDGNDRSSSVFIPGGEIVKGEGELYRIVQ